jgi:hypothetical protein
MQSGSMIGGNRETPSAPHPDVARSINFLGHLIPMNREFVIQRFEIDFDNFI